MSGKKALFGLALVLIGLLFLGKSLDLFFFSFRDITSLLLPLILIILGFWLIARKKRQETQRTEYHSAYTNTDQPQTDTTSGQPRSDSTTEQPRSDSTSERPRAESTKARTRRFGEQPSFSAPGKLKYSRAFGDIYIDCANVDLQSVEISTAFGDVEVKLHGGKLAKGLNRMVISGFIGDVRVLVPQDMPVFAQCSSFIGDVELLGNRTSGFGSNIDGQTAGYNEAESRLYIATNCFIGDVRVYVV